MTVPPIPGIVAHTYGRLLAGHDINGELERVLGLWRPLAKCLAESPLAERMAILEHSLLLCEDGEDVLRAIQAVDPNGPPPQPERLRAAHAGDLSAPNAKGRFIWPGWLVRDHLNLLSADPKTGKTHIVLDLARRMYFGLPWPDGSEPTFPAHTKVLWVCGDRHQDELRERGRAFGLPDDAILFNASPDSPYGGCNLDDPASVELLRRLIEVERPGLVAIDTVWRATHRQLRREEEVNALFDPIIAIAQDTNTAILGLMHLSKDGETLGRRLEAAARAIIKLYKPDPENQPDRRRLTVVGNFQEPPPLGVTMGTSSCEYDFNPPSMPSPGQSAQKTGRPPVAHEQAVKFFEEQLTAKNDRPWNELAKVWKETHNDTKTLSKAKDTMVADGRLVTDGGPGERRPMILHLNGLRENGSEWDTDCETGKK